MTNACRMGAIGTTLLICSFSCFLCVPATLAYDNPVNDLHGATPVGPPTNSVPEDEDDEDKPCDPNQCPIAGREDPKCKTGDPVFPASGKFYLDLKDLEIPGALPITIKRYYSTKCTYSGMFGYGWTFEYNERLYRLSDGNLALRRGDASTVKFTNTATRVYASPPSKYEIILENLDGTYTLKEPDGTLRIYGNDGTLSKIQNLKGDQLLFSYDQTGKLPISGISLYSHITTPIVIARDYRLTRIDQARGDVPLGRYVTLTYSGDGRVTNVTAHTGNDVSDQILTYGYATNGAGDMVSFVGATGRVFPYVYDNLHRMTTFFEDGCACVLRSNVYDSQNRVVTQMVGRTAIEFTYVVPKTQTKVTTRVYDEQTSALLLTKVEYFYFTASGKTSKHILVMGTGLDSQTGEQNDSVTTYTYHPVTDEPVSSIVEGGPTTVTAFDALGNVISEVLTNSNGEVLTRIYQHDLNGHVTNQYVTSSLFPGIKFNRRVATFDPQGRVLSEARVGTNGTTLATAHVYQTVGDHEVVTTTDPEGHRMTREYDKTGNLLLAYDPDNPSYLTEYEYDSRGNRIRMTDALSHSTFYEYDTAGHLVREINPLGVENLYTYDGKDVVREEIGKQDGLLGRVTLYTYENSRRSAVYRVDGVGGTNLWQQFGRDSDGSVIWEENALGLRTTNRYDAAGHLIAASDIYGAWTSNTFDRVGRLSETRNALGVRTRLDYDNLNRLTNRVEAVGAALQRATASRYDPLGNVIETRWPDGSSTYRAYDGFGRLASVSGAREYPASYQCDGNDRQTVVTDGRGFATTNQYDAYGRIAAILYPDGAVERFGYDLVGNQTSRTDGNTNTIRYSFDVLGRLATESAANTTKVLNAWAYDRWGQVTAVSNALGGVERTFYDGLGRVTNTLDAAGLSLGYRYDSLDQPSAICWPNGSYASNTYAGTRLTVTQDRAGDVQSFGYDLLGRRTLDVSTLGATNRFAYDSLNRLIAATNGLGHVTLTAYDTFDQPTAITHPDALVEYIQYDAWGKTTNHYGAGQYPVRFEYDAAGNRTRMIDGNGNPTSWTYDGRNRPIRKTYADNSFYQYAYDGAGNLKTRRDAKGVITTYTYDAANHLEKTDYPSDPDVLCDYDILGNRTRMVDASGTNIWAYDCASRALTNYQSRVNATVAYVYDAEGNRTRMTLNGDPTLYGYDASGRMTSVSNSVGLFAYIWHPDAQLVQVLRYPSGAQVTNNYDKLGRMVYHGNFDSTGGVISSFGYSYDLAGSRTNVTYTDGSRCAYGYDPLRQLTSATRLLPIGGTDTNYQYTYAYDPIGNYTNVSRNGIAERYSANNMNQYTSTTVRALLTNDANGNTLFDGYNFYAWNQEDRLAAVTNGSHRSEFVYNGFGFRVERREYEGGAIQETMRYVYDGMLPIRELNGANQSLSTVVRGLDLSAQLDMAGGIGGLLTLGSTNYCFSDGNGNVSTLFTSGNNVSASYDYDPFGHVLKAVGPAADQRYRWGSKELSTTLELSYFGLRYCSVELGRWMSRDPLGESGNANLYTYAGNDAINRFDPFGLKAYKLGSDDPTITPDPGAGTWNSKPKQLSMWALRKFIEENIWAVWFGMPDATAHLMHYFDNSGSDYTIRLQQMLDDVASAKRVYNGELAVAQSFVESLPAGDYDITSGSASGGYNRKNENWNWFYAVGGYSSWGKGHAVVKCNGENTLEFEYRFFDRYNWDGGKQVTILGVRVTDQFMGEFHRQGLAREFNMRGSVRKTVKWTKSQGR